MKTYIIDQPVRYAETDRMGVVHHSTYLLWFEIARTGLLASVGFPYQNIEAEGTMFPVVEYSCRIVGSADYGDTIRVETRIESLRSRSVVFSYKVINRGEVVAEGETKHVAVDRNLKPKRLPDPVSRALRPYSGLRNDSGSL